MTDETRRLKNGEIVLYKRSGSPKWQFRVRTRQGWDRRSSNSIDYEAAKEAALERYADIKYRANQGLGPRSKKFAAVAREVIVKLTAARKGDEGIPRVVRKGAIPRSLYSLRHTYATERILEGRVDLHTIARNMGTSMAMLEKHYSHLKPIMRAKGLAGGENPVFKSDEIKSLASDGDE